MPKFLSILLAVALCPAVDAAEADHYTLPEGEIADITGHINDIGEQGIARVLAEVNAAGVCGDSTEHEMALYSGLESVFSNHSRGELVQRILDGRIPRTVIPLRDSVYGEWTIWNGFLLGRKSAENSPLALSPLIKVGDIAIGADKLEHMFGMGRRYFVHHYLMDIPLVQVLKSGIFKEKTFLGGNIFATGVFSYADLSANFNGMRFWNHILQRRDDVLGPEYNLGPYVVCREGRWERNGEKPLDLRNYVDATMQESVNCSKFANEDGAQKFRDHLAGLAVKAGNESRSFSCPVSQELLESAARKYEVVMKDDWKSRKLDYLIINRDGNMPVSYFNEF